MGSKVSFVNFTEEMIEEYASLTYLSRYEIINLFKKFRQLDPNIIDKHFYYRIPREKIFELFPTLAYNPFQEKIIDVFSSEKDDRFSFEDVLDLCSAMSDNCPERVKAKWAFKIYATGIKEYDEVKQNNLNMSDQDIDFEDILGIIEALTGASDLKPEEKDFIANQLLKVINIQNTGGITELEFEHAVGKMSEFADSFRFQL